MQPLLLLLSLSLVSTLASAFDTTSNLLTRQEDNGCLLIPIVTDVAAAFNQPCGPTGFGIPLHCLCCGGAIGCLPPLQSCGINGIGDNVCINNSEGGAPAPTSSPVAEPTSPAPAAFSSEGSAATTTAEGSAATTTAEGAAFSSDAPAVSSMASTSAAATVVSNPSSATESPASSTQGTSAASTTSPGNSAASAGLREWDMVRLAFVIASISVLMTIF